MQKYIDILNLTAWTETCCHVSRKVTFSKGLSEETLSYLSVVFHTYDMMASLKLISLPLLWAFLKELVKSS